MSLSTVVLVGLVALLVGAVAWLGWVYVALEQALRQIGGAHD